MSSVILKLNLAHEMHSKRFPFPHHPKLSTQFSLDFYGATVPKSHLYSKVCHRHVASAVFAGSILDQIYKVPIKEWCIALPDTCR